jgi:hypothetical protein
MPPEWKTIKIPANAYDAAVALRLKLRTAGVGALPEHLREIALNEEARGIGIGTIVTMSLVALLDALKRKEQRRTRGARARRDTRRR